MKSCAFVTIARCTALHFPLALGIQATTMRINPATEYSEVTAKNRSFVPK